MNKLLQNANKASAEANFRYVQRQLDFRRAQVVKQKTSGRYVGYAGDGTYKIKLLNGGIIKARSINNAGNQVGDRVTVAESGKTFKSVPRG